MSDADKARDKIVSELLPNTTPSAYGNLGTIFSDVNYKRDGFEFDHTKFLKAAGHINQKTKVSANYYTQTIIGTN